LIRTRRPDHSTDAPPPGCRVAPDDGGAAFRDFITDGLGVLGLGLEAAQLELLDRFRRLLQERSAVHNLTTLRTDYEIAVLHVIDSLTLLLTGLFESGGRCADVGSGAGLPGIPLKVARRGLELTFVESSGKKAAFIAEAISHLGLHGCRTVAERAESLGRLKGFRDSFDLVVTRAVASVPVDLEYGVPLLRPGGAFVAMKGPRALDALDAAAGAAETLGARLEGVTEIQLPLAGQARVLMVFRKVVPTPDTYPRRPGFPAKRPLA